MDEKVVNLITEIKNVASLILEKDISSVRGFSERQVEAIAKQTIIIQKGVENGDIDKELKEFFLDGLEAMTTNFVNTLKGILSATIETVWNAIIDVLWKVIDSTVK
ncbi:hypothetical protein D1816_10585 [Aquimarina sp. AD10]|uniref:Uncharacterized protein n=1 Tax=Aquimarina aggregata TaxID=1642818 RepID=A0A163BCW3_9FLAO|nr:MULTISPECIES: hypothetical protein [Aquimarina]AXT60775.1 hypothetical protein D1816_10585 [Aquimarina sp. AD10]KZS41263.1 hypothetical protein AWE51_22940 [Aquimarina aggregata]RKM98525.1 hypothetical protein D7033_12710 [Aquimarina sp. AD10]